VEVPDGMIRKGLRQLPSTATWPSPAAAGGPHHQPRPSAPAPRRGATSRVDPFGKTLGPQDSLGYTSPDRDVALSLVGHGGPALGPVEFFYVVGGLLYLALMLFVALTRRAVREPVELLQPGGLQPVAANCGRGHLGPRWRTGHPAQQSSPDRAAVSPWPAPGFDGGRC
jgi:hypothetical protein